MNSKFKANLGWVIAALVLLGALLMWPKPVESGASTGIDFTGQIKPLLTNRCLPCHHSGALSGNLNFERKHKAFTGSDRGAFIVPGEPDRSLIYTITETKHGERAASAEMPAYEGMELTPAERELLRVWIAEGATWPSGDEGQLKPFNPKPNEA